MINIKTTLPLLHCYHSVIQNSYLCKCGNTFRKRILSSFFSTLKKNQKTQCIHSSNCKTYHIVETFCLQNLASQINDFELTYLSKIYARTPNLMENVASINKGKKQFKCETCNYIFSLKCSLKNTLLQSMKERIYYSVNFSQKQKKNQHIGSVNEGKNVCM